MAQCTVSCELPDVILSEEGLKHFRKGYIVFFFQFLPDVILSEEGLKRNNSF